MQDIEEPDIDALHRAVLREREEPTEGREPVPLWMAAAFIGLIAWGGWYLGRYDAQFDHGRIDGHGPVAAAQAPSAPAPVGRKAQGGVGDRTGGGGAAAVAPPVDLQAMGQKVYASRCAACHQGNGQGMPNVAPTLDGSEWVTEDPERLIKVVLHGLSGPIEVKGEPFVGAMPGWGASMGDEEIAAVLTWIRGAWSNDADPISPEEVGGVRGAHQRSTPWTAQEL